MSHKKLTIITALSITLLIGSYFVAANYGFFSGGTNAPSVPEDTMTRGLVGYWEFEEGTGQTAYDGSDSSNNGQLGSTASSDDNDPSWTGDGKNGGGLSFDGVDDYVDTATLGSFGSNLNAPITIELWIKIKGGTSIQQYVGILNDGVTTAFVMELHRNSTLGAETNASNFYLRDESGDELSGHIENSVLYDGNWHQVIWVTNPVAATHSVYVDGIAQTVLYDDVTKKDVIDNPADFGYDLFIGAVNNRGTSTSFFNGSIDSVRIYNRALSADEVRYHYNRGGPVGSWNFDSGSGLTAFDRTSNNNDGTLKSSGLEFDGVDDYVNLSNAPLSGTTYTVEAWFKGDGFIFSQRNSAVVSSIMGQLYMTSNNIAFITRNDSGGNVALAQGTTTLNQNEWYHAVGVRNGSNVYVYLNGVQEGTDNDAGGTITTNNKYIGRYNTLADNGWFNGSIDSVRIYNTALSAEEVARQYNNDFSQDPTGNLVLLQHFEEGLSCQSGACLTDDSGNGNNGTPTNFDNLSEYDNGTDGWISEVKKPALRWTNGKYKTAGEFDGGGDNVSVADNSQFSISNFQSISQFINFQTLATGKPISGQWGNSQNRWLIKTDDTDSDEIKVCIASGLTDDCVNYGKTTSADLTVNNWNHLYAVYDHSGLANGDKLKIYLDGAEQSLSFGGTIPDSLQDSSEELEFGGDIDLASFADVKIDNIRFYDYARTAPEIRLDYNAGVATHLGPSGKTCSEDPAGCVDYGLVGSWGMDEGTGTTAYDGSDNSNDGTLTGGPVWTTDSSPLAGGGGSLKFDGVDDYVNCGNDMSLQPTNAVTIEVWFFYIDTVGSHFVISRGRDSSSGYHLYFSGNAIRGRAWGTLGSSTVAYTLSPNTWYYGVFTYDKNNGGVLYINGEAVDTSSTQGIIVYPTDTNTAIGKHLGHVAYPYYWQGSIDSVRIYNRALSAEEVRYHYNKGGPVAEWKFDEGSGANVYDSSGGGFHGTLTE